MWAKPRWKRSGIPGRDRVPSGKMMRLRPSVQRRAASRDQLIGLQIAGNIAICPHHVAEKRAVPQLALYDALSARNVGRQENHIDQRRMVRDDDRSLARQERIRIIDTKIDDTQETSSFEQTRGRIPS